MSRGRGSPSGVVRLQRPYQPPSCGEGTVQKRQIRRPVAGSYASTNPRIPNSPPLAPTMIFPSAASGAMVNEYPSAGEAAVVSQATLPVWRSSAMTRASSVARKTRSPYTATPRFTTPQQSAAALRSG